MLLLKNLSPSINRGMIVLPYGSFAGFALGFFALEVRVDLAEVAGMFIPFFKVAVGERLQNARIHLVQLYMLQKSCQTLVLNAKN